MSWYTFINYITMGMLIFLLGLAGRFKAVNSSDIFISKIFDNASRDSSVGIATGVQAGRPSSRGSIPGTRQESFSSLNVQTGSGPRPASYPMGTGRSLPAEKRQGVKLTIHLHLVQMSRTIEVPHTPSWRGTYLIERRNNVTFTWQR
jgi:hypothetical protein